MGGFGWTPYARIWAMSERKPESKLVFLDLGQSAVIITPGVRVTVTARKEKGEAAVSTTDRISERAKQRQQWLSEFGEIFLQYAGDFLTNASHQIIKTGEGIQAEMSLDITSGSILDSLEKAKKLGFSDQKVKEIVKAHARQILVGEVRMGEEPPIVGQLREEVNDMVDAIWHPQKSPPKH